MGKMGQRALLRVIILLCRPHAAHMVNNRVLCMPALLQQSFLYFQDTTRGSYIHTYILQYNTTQHHTTPHNTTQHYTTPHHTTPHTTHHTPLGRWYTLKRYILYFSWIRRRISNTPCSFLACIDSYTCTLIN